jgi:PAS domain S-box-containing protein
MDITARRNVENTLRDSEERFRSVAETANDAIISINLEGKIVYWNNAAKKIFGYSSKEVTGKPLTIIIPKNLHTLHEEGLNRIITSKKTRIIGKTVELVGMRKGGIHFPIELSLAQLKTKEGVFFTGIIRDITDRKLAEEEQSRLWHRLEAQWEIARMVDVDSDAICSMILSEITKMSESRYGFYGFLNEDESVMTIHSWSKDVMKDCIIHKKPLEFPIEKSGVWGNAIREKKTLIINNYQDEKLPNKKGLPEGHVSINRILVVPVFRRNRIIAVGAVANKAAVYTKKDAEQIRDFLHSAQVIQDKRAVEEELKKHREHLMELVQERTSELHASYEKLEKEIIERKYAEDQAKFMALFAELNPSPVLRFDRKGKVLMANPAAVRILNINTLSEIYLSSIVPGIEELDLKECINKGIILSHSAQIGDSFFHFILRGVPESDFGQIYGSDITYQKKAEAETMRARHLASLGELAAGVAHEINNPINGIINYTQILANRSNPGTKEHDITKRIIKEGDRIAGIVNSLLSFARDMKEEKHPVHIFEIISDSLELINAQLKKDCIKLKLNIPVHLPKIIAQPQQIEQVFLNIISNARYALNQKYPGEHEDKSLEIIAREVTIKSQKYIEIMFCDKGTGIPVEITDKIMNPFFTTKPSGVGTGLGLSISHGIISDHGGKITIDTIEGECTKVIIDLPSGNHENTKIGEHNKV